MANRLALEISPYLQQHADNPVDWFPWGAAAFEEAQLRDVPIFLSVGYSACHWCHVMARESFEDERIAALLNDRFVNVKVDREERPDIDAAYMRAVRMIVDRGGWPMSVFLTPEGAPFYAGAYWPKEPSDTVPSFAHVVIAVSNAWRERRDEVLSSTESISAELLHSQSSRLSDGLDHCALDDAARVVIDKLWDRQNGGFGRAPKFPEAMTLEWLLHRHARTGDPDALDASVQALEAMARGGIHDQLGGGFARYTTDDRWLVPHFEKMLYDNALLLPAYATAAALTGRTDLVRTAQSTAGYLLGELRTEHGAFASAMSADSEGIEGRYYVWSHAELVTALADVGVDPDRWAARLGASPDGNWAGMNVLHQPRTREGVAPRLDMHADAFQAEWERIRGGLLERRAARVPPDVDDKILTDWNALAARGLIRAGVLLDKPEWVRAGAAAASFLHDHLVVGDRLHHVWRDGRASVDGFLLDHTALALADLELFQVTGDTLWFDRALRLATETHERFHDATDGAWFQTPSDLPTRYMRPKEVADDATPAGISVMIEVCLGLASLTGEGAWRDRADTGARLFQEGARTSPTRYGWFLRQIEAIAAGPRTVVIVGAVSRRREGLVRALHGRPRPGTIAVVTGPNHSSTVPMLVGRGEIAGAPTAYVCRDLACERPATTPAGLRSILKS